MTCCLKIEAVAAPPRHGEEPTGRANARPMTGSATKQSILSLRRDGLLRFARNDGERVVAPQSNRLDTDSSAAVRPMASAISEAIESTRMLGAWRTASVGWIESGMTSSLSREEGMRAAAAPHSTPVLI